MRNCFAATNSNHTEKETALSNRHRESFFKPFVQPKLTINQPGDEYEQEADAMADKVMRMPDSSVNNNLFFKPVISSIQRKCANCEEEEKKMQRKESSSDTNIASPQTEDYINSLSGGRPLNEKERSFFEPKMGYDFSNVRLHTDVDAAKSAQSINALAYTSGNNIVFNNNQYSPETEKGKRLLGHELTHVVQQNSSVQTKKIQRQVPDFLKNLDPSCTVNWQPVWEGRFDAGRDISCGAKTPLGRINSSDIYAAYQYLFGNHPPAPKGQTCPRERMIPVGGCCPSNMYYDTTQMRCTTGGTIDITHLPCTNGWVRNELGICAPVIRVPGPTTPTLPTLPSFQLPQLDFPGRIRFGSISSATIDHFAYDGYTLPGGHEAELDHLAALLNVYREVPVNIDGHTDSHGSVEYNQTLSQNRANAVKTELLSRNVQSPERIVTHAFGKSNLLVNPETNDEDKARNRRVEIWYITQSSSVSR